MLDIHVHATKTFMSSNGYVLQMVVGSNQPIVIFSQQPQQPYMTVPQADQVITSSTIGKKIAPSVHYISLSVIVGIKQKNFILYTVFFTLVLLPFVTFIRPTTDTQRPYILPLLSCLFIPST